MPPAHHEQPCGPGAPPRSTSRTLPPRAAISVATHSPATPAPTTVTGVPGEAGAVTAPTPCSRENDAPDHGRGRRTAARPP
jgi:hypothetical protein